MDNNSYKSTIISILLWTFSKFKSVITFIFKKSEFCLKALDDSEDLNSFVDSMGDRLVEYLAKGKDISKDLIKKTKKKRLDTCKNVVKKFIAWFFISAVILFLFYIIPRLAERILPIIFDSNGTPYYILSELFNILKGFYKIIELPVEIINIIFPALIGALIGFILTDGIDSLDDWFDKDIIDEFIIKKVDKDFAAIVNNTRLGNQYFLYNQEKSTETPGTGTETGIPFYNHCWNAMLDKNLGLYGNITSGSKESNAKSPHISLEFILWFRQPKYNDKRLKVYNYIDAELCAKLNPECNNFKYLCEFLTKFQEKFNTCKSSFNNINNIDGDLLDKLDDNYFNKKTNCKTFKFKIWNFVSRRPLEANKDDLERIEKEIKNEFYKHIRPLITFCKEYSLLKGWLDVEVKSELEKTLQELNASKKPEYNKIEIEEWALHRINDPRYFVKCFWGNKYSRIDNKYIKMEMDFRVSGKGKIYQIIINQCTKDSTIREKLVEVLQKNPLTIIKEKKNTEFDEENKEHYNIVYTVDYDSKNFESLTHQLCDLLTKSIKELNFKLKPSS